MSSVRACMAQPILIWTKLPVLVHFSGQWLVCVTRCFDLSAHAGPTTHGQGEVIYAIENSRSGLLPQ